MKKISRRTAIQSTLAVLGAGLTFPLNLLAGSADSSALPEASWNRLPEWHGFNLLEMFMNPHRNTDFVEDDFRMIHDWGFNFVRLPMDYRNWILDKDWRKIDESALKRIDAAVEWGRKYGIHVLLNMHRAPGYTVAKPQESKLVWDNDEALNVCTQHWTLFAKRYAGIPSKNLSFNLFNEPAGVSVESYMKVHRHLIQAIRDIDAQRLIICDGNSWGNKPMLELAELKVAQATRGYNPMSVSHYKASWVGGENWSCPTWPIVDVSGSLYSPHKNGISTEAKQPLTISGSFDKPTQLRLKLAQVSYSAQLVIEADGKRILERQFKPGPGTGEWSKVVYKPNWNCYQNYYDLDVTAVIPSGTKKVSVRLTDGDWLVFKELGLKPENDSEQTIPLQQTWDKQPGVLLWNDNGHHKLSCNNVNGKDWLYQNAIEPWQALRPFGKCVLVGEFGAFNQTPHDVVLRWFEDMLSNWKEQGWGWAQWNFRGSFGILDSDRPDVQYESCAGHKLDRKMLKLLQKYL